MWRWGFSGGEEAFGGWESGMGSCTVKERHLLVTRETAGLFNGRHVIFPVTETLHSFLAVLCIKVHTKKTDQGSVF